MVCKLRCRQVVGALGVLLISIGVDCECPETKRSCERDGGRWETGMTGEGFCNMPTSDGGDPCTDSEQCESYCVPPDDAEELAEAGQECVGTCYEWEDSCTRCLLYEGCVTICESC